MDIGNSKSSEVARGEERRESKSLLIVLKLKEVADY